MKPKLSFSALYGSHNYKLNREDSDVDMMYFYNPTYQDLYDGKMASDKIKDKSSDRKHHDVRKIPILFYKANVNFLEILFSCEVVECDALYKSLYFRRDEIASMNLPYLIEGCLGMYNRNYQNFKREQKFIFAEELLCEEDQFRNKKAGKYGAAAYRILDFTERFANQKFRDFGKAIAYEANISKDQAFIDDFMTLRDGLIGFSEIENILIRKEKQVQELKAYYKSQRVKEEVHDFVLETVETHVKEQLYGELKI